MKLFKIIGGLILSMLILGGIAFFMLGSTLFIAGKQISEEVNKPVTQTIKIDNGVEIIVPLKEKYALQYKNIGRTCKSNPQDAFSRSVEAGVFGTSIGCSGNDCDLDIWLDNKETLPEKVYVYLKKGGSCTKTELPVSQDKVKVASYEGKIELSDELKDATGIKDSDSITFGTSRSYSAIQFGGTKKVTFSYTNKPFSDILLANDELKAKIFFK